MTVLDVYTSMYVQVQDLCRVVDAELGYAQGVKPWNTTCKVYTCTVRLVALPCIPGFSLSPLSCLVCSSVGRTLAQNAECRGFESHPGQLKKEMKKKRKSLPLLACHVYKVNTQLRVTNIQTCKLHKFNLVFYQLISLAE